MSCSLPSTAVFSPIIRPSLNCFVFAISSFLSCVFTVSECKSLAAGPTYSVRDSGGAARQGQCHESAFSQRKWKVPIWKCRSSNCNISFNLLFLLLFFVACVLTDGWRQSLPEEDHPWVSRALFKLSKSGKPEIDPNQVTQLFASS